MAEWKPKRQPGRWRRFLTAEEAATVEQAEREGREAKERLAAATAILNPIRQRAAQRALHAERMGAADG